MDFKSNYYVFYRYEQDVETRYVGFDEKEAATKYEDEMLKRPNVQYVKFFSKDQLDQLKKEQ